MTVKQLIKELKKVNQNAVIVGRSDNFEKRGDVVKLSGLHLELMEEVNRKYRDAFDYEEYEGTAFVASKKGKDAIQFYF